MDLMDYRRQIIASSPHLSHAEGAVASFPDGTNLPLKSLIVDIDPVQDLRGQANPYPAGGSTNLLKSTPYGSAYNGVVGRDLKTTTTNVMDYSVQSDGKVAINVTATWTGRLFATDALSAGTYSFRLWTYASNVRATWYVTDSDLVVTEMVNNQSSAGWGNVLTRTVTEGQRIALSLSSSTVATISTEFQVNAGSSIAPIVPFENICPISGWDAVGVHDTGINVWDEEWENGDILTSNGENAGNINKIRSKNYIPVKGGQSYYFNIPPINTSYKKRCFYDKDKVFISGVNTRGGVVDVPVNACYMRFATDTNYGGTYNNDISVNYPSTDYDYHPYTGTTLSIQLGRTVYGGTLNPLTGVLTVDRQFFELDGNSNISVYAAGSASATEAYPYYAACYFPCRATENYSAWRFSHGRCARAAYAGMFRTYVYNSANVAFVLGSDSALSTTAAVKTWLQAQKDNGTPLQIVAELTTSLTYQLSPQTVRSLVGNNNIFADTGNVALDYWAHP